MGESKEKLLEMREDLLKLITNVQMKLNQMDGPSTRLCVACDGTCTACNGGCTACHSTKVI